MFSNEKEVSSWLFVSIVDLRSRTAVFAVAPVLRQLL
jgi:hypothetical protein